MYKVSVIIANTNIKCIHLLEKSGAVGNTRNEGLKYIV